MFAPSPTTNRTTSRLRRNTLLVTAVWTAFIGASLAWSCLEQRRGILGHAQHEAQISFQQAILFQFWMEDHGASASPTSNLPPSADLARAEKTGSAFPAAMLRQILSRSPGFAGYRGRLTSLKPLEPKNAPDAWETGALQAFAKGETEVASVATMDGQEYMRVMWPLVKDASCESCHNAGNYQTGEVRGGMSVSVPLAPLMARERGATAALVSVDGIIWLLGLGVIAIGARRARARMREQTAAERVLRESEARYRTLADSGQALIWTSQPDKKCDYFNQPWLAFTGRTLVRELGDGWAEGVHPDDRARCREIYATAAERRESFNAVYRLRRHDGEFRWIQDHGSPRHDRQGNFAGYIGHCLDITERKQAEVALRQSEEHYRSLFDNMLNGYAHCRMIFVDGRADDFTFLGVNRKFEALTRLKNVVGKKASEVMPGLRTSDPGLLETYGRVALSGVPEHFETFVEALDMWFSISVYRRAEGHFVAVFDVITERKRAEEKLRLFRALIEQSYDGVMVVDHATARIVDVNERACGDLGYSRDELLALRVFDVTVGVDRAAFDAMGLQLEKAGAATTEVLHRRKDGSTYPVEVSVSIVTLDREYAVVIVRDITDRKRSESALRESEERYRSLFESNPLPMWLYDPATLRFLAVNESAVNHYGYTREEFLAMTIKDIRPPEEIPSFSTFVDDDLPAHSTSEWRHRRKDGSIIRVEIVSRPLPFEGRAARLVLAADVTEKKLLEEKFLHAQRLESLGMLAAGIAHDLNNVLAPIMFAAPLLRGSLSTPRDLKILATLEQSAGRGTGLVKQILGFAHSTAGDFQTTQAKHLVRDIINVVEETFPKSIEVEQQIPSNLWPVHGNATQIHQVLMNLCVNARDALPQGGTLRIVAANRRLDAAEASAIPGARPGAWLMLEVGDTGTGIPPDALERIWTPFFTTKVAGKGTGLGLSTVRSIVLSHHGFVELETGVGRGSTFRVYLPAIESEPPAASDAPASAIPRGRGELILVVDDDAAIRRMVCQILELHGYRSVGCADGIEAIEVFNTHLDAITLVVTDVDMPRLGGVALAQALLPIHPDLRLLAISGLSRSNTGISDIPAIQELAHAFLLKPFTHEDLLGAVHRLLHPPEEN